MCIDFLIFHSTGVLFLLVKERLCRIIWKLSIVDSCQYVVILPREKMYTKRTVRKIPGEILPLPKEEHQGYIDNLANKSRVELEELLERQNKLLSNK
ncbi:hypothetical protein KPH14_005715 [Odynerus spinipes]|nr:hypothetical protein KPH14_005715 [Odynerus spinipes]